MGKGSSTSLVQSICDFGRVREGAVLAGRVAITSSVKVVNVSRGLHLVRTKPADQRGQASSDA